jgi:chorismate lyase / 3-hydroxybenzoate synthase
MRMSGSCCGHATQHAGDPRRQLGEILRNITALLEQARKITGTHFAASARETVYKVYLRNIDDLHRVRGVLWHMLGKSVRVLYLQGNFCRNDLLLETGAIYRAGV